MKTGIYGLIASAAICFFACAAQAAVTTTIQGDNSAKAKKPVAGPNSLAQKHDSKLPIEISSDTLEVLQHENKAIFHGNVIAVQGTMRLNADTMVIHYKQKDQNAAAASGGKPAPTPPPPPAPTPAGTAATPPASQGEMGAITLIEVEGHVFMATPEETAKGDKGDYVVADKLLHLSGDNVVLTRDKNILRGTELVYNLNTGQSVLTNKGGGPNNINGGRVRGVFVPNQDNGKPGAKDKNAKTAPAAGAPNAATGTASVTSTPADASPAVPASATPGR